MTTPDLSFESQPTAQPVLRPTRPLYWSIRRELWENRFLYIAPLVVTAVVLFASLMSMFMLPRKVRTLPNDPVAQHRLVAKTFGMPPAPIMLSTFIIAFFYCVDALNSERRDRSILFWKSLPVSDLTTVMSKVAIPIVVLPLLAFVLSVITQAAMFVWGNIVLTGSGVGPGILWREFEFAGEPAMMIYGLTAHVLWFAPIYGWLLLVSGLAKRAAFLWAVLPPLAICAVEWILFRTRYFLNMLQYRFAGAMKEGFQGKSMDPTPERYLTAPGLWVGLTFAAICFVAAVRLRRYREPM